MKEPILPVIIPPSAVKDWKYKEFNEIWRRTWHSMRYADEIYIIGFSLPPEDLHVRFVMRSALRASRKGPSLPIDSKARQSGSSRSSKLHAVGRHPDQVLRMWI